MNIRQQPSALNASGGRDDHRVTDNAMKLRMLAAAGVLVSAAIHLYLWFDVFRHTDVVGPAFMLNAVGGTSIAVLLVTWRHWVPLLLAVGFGASTLGVRHRLYGGAFRRPRALDRLGRLDGRGI